MLTNKIDPQDTSPIVGVDVAQSKVAVSIIESGSEAKPVRIKGKLATPNALFKDGDKIILGDQAMNRAQLAPGKLVVAFKRSLQNAPKVVIGDSGMTPYDCLRVILQFVIAALKKTSPVTAKAIADGTCRWVITVPSWFSEPTKKCYAVIADELAIALKSLVTEPIAALTYVQSQHPERFSNGDIVLVGDIGASTSDFDAVQYKEGEFHQVAGSQGIDIGGVDLTGEVYVHICEKYGHGDLAACYQPRVGFNFGSANLSLAQQLVAMKLEHAAESLKLELSNGESAETFVDIPGVGMLECSMDRSTAKKLWARTFNEVCDGMSKLVSSATERPDHLVIVGGASLTPELADRLALAAGVERTRVIAVSDSVNVIANGAAESLAKSSLGGTVLSRSVGIMVKNPATNEDVGVVLAEEGQKVSRDGLRVQSDSFYVEPRNGVAIVDLKCIEVHKGIRPRKYGEKLTVPAAKTSPLGHGRVEFRGLTNQRQRISLNFCYTNKNPEFAIYPVGSGVEPQRISLLKDDMRPETKVPLHLIVLLDGSTSMEHDLDAVKNGFGSLVPDLVSQGVAISLIVFGSKSKTLIAKSDSESDIRQAMDGLTTSGSTNMAAALLRAQKLVVPHSQNIVFLYTDGMPNSSTDSIKAAESLRSKVDRIATFGIGSLADHDLLRTQIASSSEDHFEGLCSDIPLAISSVVDLYLLDSQTEARGVSV